MKKNYSAPQSVPVLISLPDAILTAVSVAGSAHSVAISEETTTEEGRVKQGYDVWADDWSK